MLVKCGECGQPVSTNAVACPHCGNQPMGECFKCIKNEGGSFNMYRRGYGCHSPHGCCPGYKESRNPLDPETAEKVNAICGIPI